MSRILSTVHAGIHTPYQVHAGIHTLPAQCMLGHTHPSWADIPWQTHPRADSRSCADTPWQTPPRRPLQQTVRILLECLSGRKCRHCSLFGVLFSVLSLFLVQHASATIYAMRPLQCKSPFFECVAPFLDSSCNFMMSNLVKLWTGKSMNIHRSFVTTIWNQVMSLLSVKLSGTHLVSCTVMAT